MAERLTDDDIFKQEEERKRLTDAEVFGWDEPTFEAPANWWDQTAPVPSDATRADVAPAETPRRPPARIPARPRDMAAPEPPARPEPPMRPERPAPPEARPTAGAALKAWRQPVAPTDGADEPAGAALSTRETPVRDSGAARPRQQDRVDDEGVRRRAPPAMAAQAATPSDGEFVKGLKTGVSGAKQMATAAATIPYGRLEAFNVDTLDMLSKARSIGAELSEADIIEKFDLDPEDPRDRIQLGMVQEFSRSSDEEKAAIVKKFASNMLENEEIRDSLVATVNAYSEEMRETQGRVPNFTDIDDVSAFADWFSYNTGQALPYLAVSAAAGLLGGTPGVLASGYAMGVGDIQAGLVEEGVTDRGDIALLGAAPYAAIEALGPAARPFRNVGKETMTQVARGYFQRLKREIPANAVEEFINEAGQEVIKDFSVAEGTGTPVEITDEKLLQWFNAGMAGTAAGVSAAPATAAVGPSETRLPSEPDDREPPEGRKPIFTPDDGPPPDAYLTPEDRQSPVPDDVIGEGRKVIDQIVGQKNRPTPPQAGVPPLDEAAANVRTPQQDVAPGPRATERLSPTPPAAPRRGDAPQAPATPVPPEVADAARAAPEPPEAPREADMDGERISAPATPQEPPAAPVVAPETPEAAPAGPQETAQEQVAPVRAPEAPAEPRAAPEPAQAVVETQPEPEIIPPTEIAEDTDAELSISGDEPIRGRVTGMTEDGPVFEDEDGDAFVVPMEDIEDGESVLYRPGTAPRIVPRSESLPPSTEPSYTVQKRGEQTRASETIQERDEQTRETAQPAPEGAETPVARPVQDRTGGSVVVLQNEDLTSIEPEPEVFQYKSGGDAEGVTERLRGVREWDTTRAGTAIVYEYADGRRVIADGHQRLRLAKDMRAKGQDVEMPTIIRREADGYTPEDVMVEAALKNIAEAPASATADPQLTVDAAKVMRSRPDMTVEEMNLPPKSAMVRHAGNLRRLSDDAFGMVVNDTETLRNASAVGKVVENQAVQSNILGMMNKLPIRNEFQAEQVARQAAADTQSSTQESLFGDEQVEQTTYLERARILDSAVQRLKKDRSTFKTLVEREGAISEAGNRLDREANERRLQDADFVREYLTRQATTKGPVSDALSQAAQDLKSGGDIRQAVSRVIQAVQRTVPGSRQEGVTVEGTGRVDEQARPREENAGARRAEVAPPEAPEPSEQGNDITPEFLEGARQDMDRRVFRATVAKSVQKDGQRVLDAMERGDIDTLRKVRDARREEATEFKSPRRGVQQVYEQAERALEAMEGAEQPRSEPARPATPKSQSVAGGAARNQEPETEVSSVLSGGENTREGWVLRDRETGEVAMETKDRAKVDALNTDKYEAVPVRQHLAELNDPESRAAKAASSRNDRQEIQEASELTPVAEPAAETDAGRNWNDVRSQQSAMREMDRRVFEPIVPKSVQDDGQRVLNAMRDGDLETIRSIRDKYQDEAGRAQGGGGAGPGKEKSPRRGVVAVHEQAEAAVRRAEVAQLSEMHRSTAEDWGSLSIEDREAITKKAGWTTNKGTISQTGRKIARRSWSEHPDNIQGILARRMPTPAAQSDIGAAREATIFTDNGASKGNRTRYFRNDPNGGVEWMYATDYANGDRRWFGYGMAPGATVESLRDNGTLDIEPLAATEPTEAGQQAVIPGAEQDATRSEAARGADQRREVEARQQQSRMRSAEPQGAPGGLFDTQGDMFDDTSGTQDKPAVVQEWENASNAAYEASGEWNRAREAYRSRNMDDAEFQAAREKHQAALDREDEARAKLIESQYEAEMSPDPSRTVTWRDTTAEPFEADSGQGDMFDNAERSEDAGLFTEQAETQDHPPAADNDAWRVEEFPSNDPESRFKVLRKRGDNQKDAWGYYPTREQAESAREFAEKETAKKAAAQKKRAETIAARKSVKRSEDGTLPASSRPSVAREDYDAERTEGGFYPRITTPSGQRTLREQVYPTREEATEAARVEMERRVGPVRKEQRQPLGNETLRLYHRRLSAFYSPLLRAIEGAKQKQAPAKDWKAIIGKLPGVKKVEIEWLGVEEWLDAQEGQVRREDIAEFVRESQIEVVEDTLADGRSDADGEPRFESYTEPGGENYREILLRVPDLHRTGKNRPAPAPEDPFEQVPFDPDTKSPFVQSAHFEQENIVVHARVKDRTGPNGERVLFVEEIQSDLASVWRENQEDPAITARRRALKKQQERDIDDRDALAQQFRRESRDVGEQVGNGYEREVSPLALAELILGRRGRPSGRFQREAYEFLDVAQSDEVLIATARKYVAAKEKADATNQEILALGTERSMDPSTPDTPFKEEHTYSLMVKRLLRMAAEEGYDRLSWTPGYMQAERWNSAAQSVVEGIDWKRIPSGVKGGTLTMSQGNEIVFGVNEANGNITESSSPELVGKPLSALIGPKLAGQVIREETGSVSGQKITFPDSGYAIAYDQQTRKAVDKLAKGSGAKVYVDKTLPDMVEDLRGDDSDMRSLDLDRMVEWMIDRGYDRARIEKRAEDIRADDGLNEIGKTRTLLMAAEPFDRRRMLDDLLPPQDARPVWAIDITDDLRAKALEPMAILRRDSVLDERKVQAVLPDLRKRLDKLMIRNVDLRYDPTMTAQGAVEISPNDDIAIIIGAALNDVATLNHEVIHVLRARGLFRDREWAALRRQAERDWIRRYDISERYSDLDREGQIEEAIAEAFADWTQGNLKLDGETKGAMARIRRFFRAVMEALRGQGITTPSDIFRTIESGAVGAREGMDAAPARMEQRQLKNKTDESGFSLETIQEIARLNRETGGPMIEEQLNLPPSFNAPKRKGMTWVAELMQDKYAMFRAAEAVIEQTTGQKLPEAMSFSSRETVFRGRSASRLEKVMKEEVRPLTDAMSKEGVSLDDVGRYLIARHAPERNAVMAKRNPERFGEGGGSGMTDETAAQVMQQFRDKGNIEALDRVAKLVDSIIARDLRQRHMAGLISKAQYDSYRSMYQYYTPLRGFAEREDGDQTGTTGAGFSLRGKEVIAATGRSSLSDNPVVQAIAMRQQGIMRAEKNRVGKALLRLVQKYPNPDLWETVGKLPTREVLNKDTGMVQKITDFGALDQDEMLAVKVGGQTRWLRIKDPMMARAAKNLDDSLGDSGLAKIAMNTSRYTRAWARLQTGANPDFVIPNALADLFEGVWTAYNIKDTKKMARSYVRYYPRALAQGIRSELEDSPFAGTSAAEAIENLKGMGMTPEEANKFRAYRKEWEAAGGKINFMAFRDLDEITRDINRDLRKSSGEPVVKITEPIKSAGRVATAAWERAEKTVQVIEKINQPVESAGRLAMYIAAREQGLSKERAAALSLDASGNYYRRGRSTRGMAAFYAFFNPAVQGVEKFVRFSKQPRNWAVIAGLAAANFSLSLYNMYAWGDDDDPEGRPLYLDVPEWERARGIIIPYGIEEVPYDDKDGNLKFRKRLKYLTFRVPHNLRPIMIMGDQFAALWHAGGTKTPTKHTTPSDATELITRTILINNNPMGAESFLVGLSPTVSDPIAELYINRKFSGLPIYPTDYPNDIGVPNAYKFYERSTSGLAIGAADLLNRATGGGIASSGFADIHPDKIEHVAEYIMGGLGKFLLKSGELAVNKVQGVETKAHRVPLFRTFMGETGNFPTQGRYYEMRNYTNEAKNNINRLKHVLRDDPGNQEAREEYDRLKVELNVGGEIDTDFDWKNSTWRIFYDSQKKIKELNDRIASMRFNDEISRPERIRHTDAIHLQIEEIQEQAQRKFLKLLTEIGINGGL